MAPATRRILLLLVLLAAAIALPPFLGIYYVRFATQIAIYGMAAVSIDLLLGYTGLITFGQVGAVRRRRLCGRHADGLRLSRPHRGPAARDPDLDGVRARHRRAVAAHARLPVHHGDARVRPDGLLFQPEPARLGRRRRLHACRNAMRSADFRSPITARSTTSYLCCSSSSCGFRTASCARNSAW